MIKAAKPIKPPRWYNGEKFEYDKELLTKGAAVAYFKFEAGRRGGSRSVTKFIKIFENGMAVTLDVTMKKLSITQGSLSTPFQLRNSNKREFDQALKHFLFHIQ